MAVFQANHNKNTANNTNERKEEPTIQKTESSLQMSTEYNYNNKEEFKLFFDDFTFDNDFTFQIEAI